MKKIKKLYYFFLAILYIYQTNGYVRRPPKIPIDLFVCELQFYDLGVATIDAFWVSEGYETPSERLLPKNKLQRHVWLLLEYADSSTPARSYFRLELQFLRLLAAFSVLIILMSISVFCLETVEALREPFALVENYENPFFISEVFCIIW